MKVIELTRGMVALIDDRDFEELSKYSWHAHFNKTNGTYVARRIIHLGKKSKGVRMHRQIMGVTNPKIQVDHINLDTLDNRRSNLRLATNGNNECNKRKQPECSSIYKGVCWRKSSSKWRARINIPNSSGVGHGKRVELGSFSDQVEAAIAYDEAAKIHYGEFAKLNFPEGIPYESRKLG